MHEESMSILSGLAQAARPDTLSVLTRIESEMRVLAAQAHANIARVDRVVAGLELLPSTHPLRTLRCMERLRDERRILVRQCNEIDFLLSSAIPIFNDN